MTDLFAWSNPNQSNTKSRTYGDTSPYKVSKHTLTIGHLHKINNFVGRERDGNSLLRQEGEEECVEADVNATLVAAYVGAIL